MNEPHPSPEPALPSGTVHCRDDSLVRAAMRHPRWAQVGAAATDALSALYAEAEKGVDEEEFRERIAAIIRTDNVLSALVVMGELDTDIAERGGVLAMPGSGAPPHRWVCPEPGCRVSVPGGYSRPAVEAHCSEHLTRLLVRTP